MGLKEKLPLLNSGSKPVRLFGYVAYAFVILILIGIILPSPEVDDSTTEAATTPAATAAPAEAEEEPEVAAEPAVLDVAAVRKLMPSSERDAEIQVSNGAVIIRRESGLYRTLDSNKIASADIFKNLFKDDRVKEVTVFSSVGLVDAYGQESTATGTKYTMTRETASKINWDNFLWSNLDNVADGVYIHPALQ